MPVVRGRSWTIPTSQTVATRAGVERPRDSMILNSRRGEWKLNRSLRWNAKSLQVHAGEHGHDLQLQRKLERAHSRI